MRGAKYFAHNSMVKNSWNLNEAFWTQTFLRINRKGRIVAEPQPKPFTAEAAEIAEKAKEVLCVVTLVQLCTLKNAAKHRTKICEKKQDFKVPSSAKDAKVTEGNPQ